MKIYDNGIYRDMTAEELQSTGDVPEVEEEITAEERIEALEAAILELAEVVLNG